MLTEPEVSVIIPTFNRAQSLVTAISSVLNQTFSDIELIVVDDASTDQTVSVVQSIADDRVRLVCHDLRRGATHARNSGIRVANGKYIAFQDSDDEWYPEKLAKQMEVFKDPSCDAGVVSCGYWIQGTQGKTYRPSGRFKNKCGEIHNALLWENFLDTPSLIVKRICFELSGVFDPELPRFQDWDLCLRISKYYRFEFVDEPLYVSNVSSNSISTDSGLALDALRVILKKNHDEIVNNKALLAHYKHWLAILLLQNASEKSEPRRLFLESVKNNPRNAKYYVSLFGSYLCPQLLLKLIESYQLLKN